MTGIDRCAMAHVPARLSVRFSHTSRPRNTLKPYKMRFCRTFQIRIFALVALLACFTTFAETENEATAVAHPLTTTPTFDGNVRGDEGWADIVPFSNFTQHLPNIGEPASLKTEVYLGYTDEALHIGFISYEDDLEEMFISGNGWESDGVLVVIDTYQNEVSGYGFSTNQVGAEWDTSVYNGNTDWNWSTVWQVKSQIHEDSWSSEMVIPFTSLHYPNSDVQTWRFNFSRYIRSRNEVSHWAPIPRQHNIWRLGLARDVTNIRPPPPKKNIKFNPYGLTSRSDQNGQSTEDISDFGFDIRYSLTPTLNLDATYNTDFAHVNLDSLQINTGRFSLFFPETRPFFLENARLFDVGVPRETLLFHSRRIGVSRNGTRLPMDGGVKLTGNVGIKNQVGLMHLRADSEIVGEYEDFTIARYSRDLQNRSKFGFLATNRKTGSNDAQTFGTDLQWGIGEITDIRAFVATTRSDDGTDLEDEYAYALYANFNSTKWHTSASYHEVGAGFNPAVGFAQRRDSRKVHMALQRTFAIEDLWNLNEFRTSGIYTAYWDFDGNKESGYLDIGSSMDWKNGANLQTSINVAEERVTYGFRIAGEEVLPGDYESPQISIGVNSPQDRNWNLGANIAHGDFYQGETTGFGMWSNYTHSEHFNVSLNYSYNKVDFPNLEEPFDFSLARLGGIVSFTPKIRLHSLLQYNAADDVFSANVRFAWLRRASTGFYLVYNQIDERNMLGVTKHESVVLKYSHMFDVNV